MTITKLLKNKTTFIVGAKKNAGKTTFLNYAIANLRPAGRLAYLTIGVDGEKTDRILGNPKPQIFARRGDILLTTDSAIKQSDASFKILNTYPFTTSLGKLSLTEVLRDGRAEIIGAQTNLQLAEILADIKKHKIKTVLVDGAVDRITQIASQYDSSFVYIAKIEPENLNSAINSIKLIYRLWKTPSAKANDGKSSAKSVLRLSGAVTKSKISIIKKSVDTIIFDDFTKIFITYSDWQILSQKHRLYFSEKFELSSFIVNLYNVSKGDFDRGLNSPEIMKKIIFNPYIINAK